MEHNQKIQTNEANEIIYKRKINQMDVAKIREVHSYILKNINKDIPTIKTLANMVGTNENKLRKGFHLIYGTSIGNFILHQRLKLSLPLVESSNLSIKSISLNLGFKSYSHFSTSFKAYFGISPKYYRIQAQSREMEL